MACRDCCTTIGLEEIFGERRARREMRRYRRRGVDRETNRLLAELAAAVPLEGATSFEVGAGVGGLSIELLRRGVARAAAIEALPHYAAAARELADEAGVGDRFDIEVGDFAYARHDQRYDVVVLNRVVCCYPDWRALLRPAAAMARRAVALSYPREAWWTRALSKAINGVQGLLRRRYRNYVHPPTAMQQALRESGLEPRVAARVGVWEIVVATR